MSLRVGMGHRVWRVTMSIVKNKNNARPQRLSTARLKRPAMYSHLTHVIQLIDEFYSPRDTYEKIGMIRDYIFSFTTLYEPTR